MSIIGGMKIVESSIARDVRTEFQVLKWPGKEKRRKKWFVRKIEINRPGCFSMGGVLYMHPDLIAALKVKLSK